MKCIKCGEEATKRISPDLDIAGIRACEEHVKEIHADLMVAILGDEFEWFEKKYKLK